MAEFRGTDAGYEISVGVAGVGSSVDVASVVTATDAAASVSVSASESPRPYIHPLRSLAGRLVSDYRPSDHAWHWGLSIAVSNIEVPGQSQPVNLWGGVTWQQELGYVQLENNGAQRHDAFAIEEDSAGRARALDDVTWLANDGAPFLAEKRRTSATAIDTGSWRLDVESEWHNLASGPLRFGSPTTAGRPNAGYGGFFLRGATELLDARVLFDGHKISADDAMGQRGDWVALSQPTASVSVSSVSDSSATASVTVAMWADPANPVGRAPWFVRTSPVVMLCAAPFFHDEWELAEGATATWRWSLLVADGELDAASIADALVR
ncbi:PmoA family protein [Glaciibacter superstes]|uniref:DUF6807 domain-containing protein n=1 Tax=Glaciibacter superstes TaxID=501023 RepID=UPI0003B45F80|nr:PmoA family protein [Glaciibacter superstes]